MPNISTGVVQVLGTINASLMTANAAFLGYWGFAPGTPNWSLRHLSVLSFVALAFVLIALSLSSLMKPIDNNAEFSNVQQAKKFLFCAMVATFIAFGTAIVLGF